MMISFLRVLITLACLAAPVSITSVPFVRGQSPRAAADPVRLLLEDPTCLSGRNDLISNGKGQPRIFGPKELRRMASDKVAPQVPFIRGKSVVTVYLVVGLDGKVLCARAVGGHTILRLPAEEAARKWTYKPIAGRTFLGRIVFTFNYNKVSF